MLLGLLLVHLPGPLAVLLGESRTSPLAGSNAWLLPYPGLVAGLGMAGPRRLAGGPAERRADIGAAPRRRLRDRARDRVRPGRRDGWCLMASLDILLPFYGDVGYLRLAVESVLAQTDPDWRLVVVDDGYPDPSVAAWFAALGHPQVHYSRNAANLGANGNYRHALTLAEADWVVVMGADDLMLPTYVATVRALVAGHPSAAVVQPGVGVVDSDGRPILPVADRVKAALRPGVPGVRRARG